MLSMQNPPIVDFPSRYAAGRLEARWTSWAAIASARIAKPTSSVRCDTSFETTTPSATPATDMTPITTASPMRTLP